VIELLLEAERALSFGRVDRAEEIYQQVVGSDPKNSIAVVGLARVALERTDDLGAYLLARRALTIDPENDAARRLASRLEEVLATRGEPVADPLPPVAAAPQAAAEPADQEPRDGGPAPTAEPATHERGRRSLIDRLRRR
jgi:thioredoxin-like negative regulator of GroEL